MKQALMKPAAALVALMMCCGLAFAQVASTGSLAGTVTDPQGAVVAGATVVVRNNETRVEQTVQTSDSGTFNVPALPTGTYTVTITGANFKQTVVQDVKVNVGTPSSINVALEIGGANETVTITGAGGELLQTQTATVGTTITGRQITELPQASRDALDLVLMLPGTSTVGRPRSSSVNGLPKGALNITMDGINVQDNSLKSSDGFFTYIRPRIDAIEEVTVSTATPGAESSGEGAVQIKFATRKGTSEFHGSAYWYHRNPSLNANFWFNNRDLPEDPVDRKAPRTRQLLNQPGVRVGGPITIPGLFNTSRDKAFFMVNWEKYFLPERQLRTRRILTPAAQAGNYTFTAGGVTQTVNVLNFAGGTADPTVAALLAEIRATTSQGSLASTTDPNIQNFTFINPGSQERSFPTVRLDYNISNNHSLENIWNYQVFDSQVDFLNGVDPAFPGFPNFASQKSLRFSNATALRSTFGSSVVNEARFGLTGGTALFFPEVNAGQFTNQGGFNLGIGAAASGIQGASVITTPSRRNAPVKQFTDTVTWTRGEHTFNFGGNISRYNFFQQSFPFGVVPTVSFADDAGDTTFNQLFTTGALANATTTQQAEARSLFRVLTGRVTSISGGAVVNEAGQYQFNGDRIDRFHQWEWGMFAQDSWRLRPNLTLNIGLRYENQRPVVTENLSFAQTSFEGVFGRGGRNGIFNPNGAGGTVTQFNQLPEGAALYKPDNNNFAPSVGFAWQPDWKGGLLGRLAGDPGQTVIRGGAAIAFTREGLFVAQTVASQNPGGTLNLQRIAGNFAGLPRGTLLRNIGSVPAPTFAASPQFPITGNPLLHNAAAFDPDIETPYVGSWTIGVQREITRDTVVEARYVGNRGIKLQRFYFLNEINTVENGFFNEFRAAQANLQANLAANRGANFRYFGPGTGTSPLPTILAYFRGSTAASPINANDPAQYTSAFFANATFLNTLIPVAPNAPGFAGLLNNPANGFRPNAEAAGLPATFFQINPDIAGNFIVDNGARTWYDAFQFEVRRRMSRGLLMQFNYTFSKSLTDFYASSALNQANYVTLRDPRLNKTNSPFDIRHASKLNWIYELPIGRGKMWGGDMGKWTNALIGGWEWHGTLRVQSGVPLNLGNVQLVGMTREDLQKAIEIRKLPNKTVFWLADDIILNTRRAFSVVTPTATNPQGIGALGAPTGRYIAPASNQNCIQAFAGQCGFSQLIVHGPRFIRNDMSLVKKFHFTENTNFEMRAEFLNAINNINWKLGQHQADVVGIGGVGIPTYTSTQFGQLTDPDTAYRDISTTNDPGGRLVQIVLRFNF